MDEHLINLNLHWKSYISRLPVLGSLRLLKIDESIMRRTTWLTKFASVWYFLVGCETYFIAPTAWYYIKTLGQTKLFLALVLCSFNIGSVVAGPLLGFLTDRFGNPRFLFIFCCSMKAFAYMIYSVNFSAYFPLCGRFISGLGNGAGFAILLGQVVLQSDEGSRGKFFIFLECMFVVGSAFGPGIASFIIFRVNILGWKIDDGNSPGIVLAIIWLLFFIASLLFPRAMWVESVVRKQEQPSTSSDNEIDKRLSEHRKAGKRRDTELNIDEMSWHSRVFCLFFLIFCSEGFSSTSTFYVPILGLDHFYLQEVHIKLLFLNCIVFTLLVFLAFYIASRYTDQRKLLIIAMLLQITAILFLTSLAFSWDQVTSVQYYILLIYSCFGMPFFAYPLAGSMLSTITDPRNASFVQGSAYATLMSAIVLSRVVISFIFTKTSLICYCFVLTFIWLVGFIWYGIVYKRLLPNDKGNMDT